MHQSVTRHCFDSVLALSTVMQTTINRTGSAFTFQVSHRRKFLIHLCTVMYKRQIPLVLHDRPSYPSFLSILYVNESEVELHVNENECCVWCVPHRRFFGHSVFSPHGTPSSLHSPLNLDRLTFSCLLVECRSLLVCS